MNMDIISTQEQMKRAVNDMVKRFPDINGIVSSEFFASRLDKIKEDDFKKYDIPFIADQLFKNGAYKRKEIAGLEVEEDPDGTMPLRRRLRRLGYGARTNFNLKSQSGKVLGSARVTFMYQSPLIVFSRDFQSTPSDQSDNFSREMDFLRVKYSGEAVVYVISKYRVGSTKPGQWLLGDLISEIVDERDEGAVSSWNYLRSMGYGQQANRLPGNQAVIDYFKKIWMLSEEF